MASVRQKIHRTGGKPALRSRITHARQTIHRMGGSSAGATARHALDLAVAALAASQHGVVSVAQLLEIGLTHRMIEGRVARGWLHRIHHGVYAVGHTSISREGRWMAATLACGPAAVLSHGSAAAHQRIRDTSAALIDVSSPGRIGRSRRGIRVHSGDTLRAADVTVVRGIPCTTLPRTIVDLSAFLDRQALEYVLHRAETGPAPIDFSELTTLLDRFPGRPGTPRLRSLLGSPAGLGDRRAKSGIERAFLALCRKGHLPAPRVNAWIPLPMPAGGLEVDFSWPERRLAVETDSATFHDTVRARRHDPARDRALMLAGWRVARYTWWDVTAQPARVASELRDLLEFPA
jgi:very-short-patch-repair endonuclease